ncbi:MAG: hypothetical protein GX287_07880 [Fusobacteria bacterium]|nr:hypothetical protein [Fusobacteriota bacterium]
MSDMKQLLDTMELIHYITINKDKVFVLLIKGQNYIREIIPDIIILKKFGIKFVIVIDFEDKMKKIEDINNDFTKTIWEIAAVLKKHSLSPMSILGTNISVKKREDSTLARILDIELDTIKYALSKNKIPVIAPLGMDFRGHYHIVSARDLALEVSKQLQPSTIFYISNIEGIKQNDKIVQFLHYESIVKIIEKDEESKPILDILKYSKRVMDEGIRDISILDYKTGNIYTKVLTYDIAGTLISKVDEESIREADIEDINSIYLLIRNETLKNNILPITEEEIEVYINNYLVYVVDSSVVAVGTLKYFGNCAEIAKIATYPRYQGGKKAKALCFELVNKAIKEGLDFVFGLTVNIGMEKLFLSLGFNEIDRSNLPEEWKKNYDFSRPSKSYIKYLK